MATASLAILGSLDPEQTNTSVSREKECGYLADSLPLRTRVRDQIRSPLAHIY